MSDTPPQPHYLSRPRGLKRGEKPLNPKSELREGVLYVTSHEFKTHMAQYLRLMEQDPAIDYIVLKQYKAPIAMIAPMTSQNRP